MKDSAQAQPLQLLCFSLGPALFGIDLEQLARISVYRGEEGEDLFWLHRLWAYPAPPVYADPRILAVKGEASRDGRPYRLVIDAPREVLEIDWRKIRPLPPLLAPQLLPRGLWGVLPLAESLLLLLDCRRLVPGVDQ